MAYTETTKRSYGNRVSGSFRGIGGGFILFCLGTALLWWNEGRAVKTDRMLSEAQKEVVHVDDVSELNPSLNGQLIHAFAETSTTDQLTDEDFGFSTVAIALGRTVEYYQYNEKASSSSKDKLGGAEETTTTYTYEKGWVSSPVNSDEFKDPAYQNKNTTIMQYEARTIWAENVHFGAYKLTERMLYGLSYVDSKVTIPEETLRNWDKLIATQKKDKTELAELAKQAKAGKTTAATTEATDSLANDSTELPVDNTYKYVHATRNGVYFGLNPNSPAIGDLRVTFKQINPGMTTVIAKVMDDTFEPYTAKNGKRFSALTSGKVSIDEIFENRQSSNNMFLWIGRIFGILLVIGGLKGIFDLLSTLLKVVPFLANIMNFGVGLVCNIVGVVWSLLVIALAWIFYRPVIGVSIIVVIVAIVGFFAYRGKKKQPAPKE